MLTGLVYFLVIFISVTIGAISGLSGGIIVKPILVFLNDYDIVTITILSSVAVFAMSSTNLLTRLKAKEKVFSIELLSLIIGSMVGGYIGNLLFESFIVNFDKGLVSIFQTLVLITLLLFVIISRKINFSYNMKQGTIKNLFLGLSLGIIAAFLGIGGGPINMGAILLLFGLSIKEAANMSILIIFFSQLTNIITIAINGGFIDNNMEMLPVVLVAGISAGIVGRYISLRTSEKKVEILFDLVLIVIMVINIMNLF